MANEEDSKAVEWRIPPFQDFEKTLSTLWTAAKDLLESRFISHQPTGAIMPVS
jgi:hypothetical protein